jgi:UDP-N-acetylmuramate: L-alanyl-gamma-D-glutamyl-meso-diaminopimelate ligase
MSAREHIHLIGIGGTGMTALAGLLHEAGCRVTGSDRDLYPPTSTILAALSLEPYLGFDPKNLVPAPDLVVIGNAVSRGNPEVEEVLDRGLPYTSMPRCIAERFLPGRHSIVVAGTHGKTTTTSMLAWLLDRAGRSPGFLVGGLPQDFDRPFRVGSGTAFVIEGDEYDTAFFDKGPKFMHYRPDTVLLGTVEYDHADIYRDAGEVERVFERLVNLVPRRGLIVRNEDCARTRHVTDRALSRIVGCGLERGDWRAVGVIEGAQVCRFQLLHGERAVAEVALGTGGEHNVRNALAAAAAAHEQGLTPQEIADGLSSFRGVRRRLELRGERDGVAVFDDFAHHPTAVAYTLETLRQRFPDRKIWAVLEPRSWSMRRNTFQDRLPESLQAADETVLANVYRIDDVPSADRLDPEKVVIELIRRGRSARFLPEVSTILESLASGTSPGDVVVIMTNGGFENLHTRLLDALEEREGQRRGNVRSGVAHRG